MRIISWNVAGLRARLKLNEELQSHLSLALFSESSESSGVVCKDFDIVCIQETKCSESDVKLPSEITNNYPYRLWNSTKGTTQRKGFSGTCVWSINQPIKSEVPDFDEEGRIIMVEFEKFILVNVYVPNSQKFENDRYKFRQEWNNKFYDYLKKLDYKELIICGDMNVAHLDIDITNPASKKNKIAGFFDFERVDFSYMLQELSMCDIYRMLNPNKRKSTYWSNYLKSSRKSDNGWRIDYFLISENIEKDRINNCNILMEITGSDHCPIELDINL